LNIPVSLQTGMFTYWQFYIPVVSFLTVDIPGYQLGSLQMYYGWWSWGQCICTKMSFNLDI